MPHYFMAEHDFRSIRHSHRIYRAGFCDVTGQGNERSILCSLVSDSSPCGNKVPTAMSDGGLHASLLFSSLMNSFVVDFLLRKVVSNSLNFFIIDGLPINRLDPGGNESAELIKFAGLLTCTTPEMTGLWAELARHWPQDFPLPWSRERACLDVRARAKLRAHIDARIARIYGLTAHEYIRVLYTFPLLDGDQPPLPGDVFIRMTNRGERIGFRSFITRDLALLTFLELTGQEPPTDIVAFFAQAGVDIQRQTGPFRDLARAGGGGNPAGRGGLHPQHQAGLVPGQSLYAPGFAVGIDRELGRGPKRLDGHRPPNQWWRPHFPGDRYIRQADLRPPPGGLDLPPGLDELPSAHHDTRGPGPALGTAAIMK